MNKPNELQPDRMASIPHGRAQPVETLIKQTRERLAGLPMPTFGVEPADFLKVLRRTVRS
jgi:hypothetical protein